MKFIAEEDSLTIELEGWEILLGLKRKLVLPRKDVESLRWTPEFMTQERFLRLAGCDIPNTLYSGSFRSLGTGSWAYLYLRRPSGFTAWTGINSQNVLIVTMRNNKYQQIILSCQPDIGSALMKWRG